jgi:GNAT superfamily N-acetyltransferase
MCQPEDMAVSIRPALAHEILSLREVERTSGERFREVGLDDVADAELMSVESFGTYIDAGLAWVATDDSNEMVVGFVLVDEIDDAAHIEQVSVIPERQGQGIGRALIAQVRRWAERNHLQAMTLTTFDHVPWNRPLYEHLGFRVLTEDEMGPGLRTIRETEASHGLDPALRVVMRQPL